MEFKIIIIIIIIIIIHGIYPALYLAKNTSKRLYNL